MTTHIGAGPIIPVTSITEGAPPNASVGGPAIPVYVYTSIPAGRQRSGGKPLRVRFLSASDLRQNGGAYVLEGRPQAMPVIVTTAAASGGEIGDVPVPVFDVTAINYP